MLHRLTRKVEREYRQSRVRRLAARYRFPGGYRRIYHYHIRKTGGTSLNHMFLSLGGEAGADVYAGLSDAPGFSLISGDKVFVGWNKREIEQGNYFYAFSHTPVYSLNLPDKTFTVTCLRDPVQRVLSHYKMLLETQRNASKPRWFDTEAAWLGDNLSEFLTRIPQQHLLNQLYMFSTSFDVDEAFERIVDCSHWFLNERFDEGVRTLSAKLGIPLVGLHVRQSTIDPQITPAEMGELRQRLEPEYRLYDRLRSLYDRLL